MSIRNPNLLLSAAAAPANGIQRGNIVQWYGGNFRAMVTGAFDGCTVDVMINTNYPASGDRAAFLDSAAHPDAEFVSIGSLATAGEIKVDNLNPCALCCKVSSVGANTRLKVIALDG